MRCPKESQSHSVHSAEPSAAVPLGASYEQPFEFAFLIACLCKLRSGDLDVDRPCLEFHVLDVAKLSRQSHWRAQVRPGREPLWHRLG